MIVFFPWLIKNFPGSIRFPLVTVEFIKGVNEVFEDFELARFEKRLNKRDSGQNVLLSRSYVDSSCP